MGAYYACDHTRTDPEYCHRVHGSLLAEPEGSRIGIVEGDIFKTPLPADHDVLLVANTVHVLSAPHNLALMRKMQRGARLLLVDVWMNSAHTDPPAAAPMSGEFLVMAGEGQAYSEQEADHWLGQTGWRRRCIPQRPQRIGLFRRPERDGRVPLDGR